MLYRLNVLLNKLLTLTLLASLGALLIVNSALKEEGIVIGHPRREVVYVQADHDAQLTQLAAAIDEKQLLPAPQKKPKVHQ